MEPKKNNSSKIIIAIVVFVGVLFVLLACGGVLAAIAVPSFIRYTQQSKTAEAKMITTQMANFAKMAFIETCEFPEALQPTTDPAECCGGEKCVPVGTPPEIWALNTPGLWDGTYFSYSALPSENGMTIAAEADFRCGEARHRMVVEVIGTKNGSTCDATVAPGAVENEFE